MRKGLLLLAHATLLFAAHVSAGVFQVTTAADSGPGSLRQAIIDANASTGSDDIRFATIEGQPFRIVVTTPLPEIIAPVSIDGRAAAGFNGVPIVELNGNNRDMSHGLKFGPGANGSSVFALAINGFGGNAPSHGIWFADSDNNLVDGCHIGVNTAGDAALRNRGDGVVIQASDGNRIVNSIISGNRSYGVHILGPNANGNEVSNCAIGLNAAEIAAIGNFRAGIGIEQAIGTRIHGNTISGNTGPQIEILGIASSGTLVYGNYIGTKGDGTSFGATPSSAHGIRISGAPQTVIGGDESNERNVFGNNQFAIVIIDTGANGTIIQGNYIGTDATGLAPAPNHGGISIGAGSSGTIVGGPLPALRNLISGNRTFGLSIQDSSDNRVAGNFIGLGADGLTTIPNTLPGTDSSALRIGSLTGIAQNNIVGGETDAAANFISGNSDEAITIFGDGATANVVSRNAIGFNANLSAIVGNGGHGVAVLGADNNRFHFNLVVGSGNAGTARDGFHFARSFDATGNASTGNVASDNFTGFNSGNGIVTYDPNDVDPNSYAGNGGLLLDVGNDGPNANLPTVESVARNPWRVTGILRGTPGCPHRVTVFGVSSLTQPVQLAGLVYPIQRTDEHTKELGSFVVTPEADGIARFADKEFAGSADGLKIRLVAFAECDGEPQEFGPLFPLGVAADPAITFEDPVINVDENGAPGAIALLRSGDVSEASAVDVQIHTVPSTGSAWTTPALSGIDYINRHVTFEPGQIHGTISFNVGNDETPNGVRVAGVTLSQPVNAAIAQAEATILINDDDLAGVTPRLGLTYALGQDRRILTVTQTQGLPVGIEITSDLAANTGYELIGPTGSDPFDIREAFAELRMPVSAFARASIDEDLSVLFASVQNGNGGPLGDGIEVAVGRAGAALPLDGLVRGVPSGLLNFDITKAISIPDNTTGQPLLSEARVLSPILIQPDSLVSVGLRVAVAAEQRPLSAENRRNPWAAIVSSVIGNLKTVSVAGGYFGDRGGNAAIQVTGPGVSVVLDPSNPNRVFESAGAGQWTVTTSVDGAPISAIVDVP